MRNEHHELCMSKISIQLSQFPVEYQEAEASMIKMVNEIHSHQLLGKLWFLEHPHVYTLGTSANDSDLLNPTLIPIHVTGRGGKHTYHGPGQRIIYTMLNLKKLYGNTPDIRLFINQLENWIIESLKSIGVASYKVPERVGIWVKNGPNEQKIAAIGIRVSKSISYHGVAININPDLSYFNGIVPCGLKDFGICSLKSLGINMTMAEFDDILIKHFYQNIG